MKAIVTFVFGNAYDGLHMQKPIVRSSGFVQWINEFGNLTHISVK